MSDTILVDEVTLVDLYQGHDLLPGGLEFLYELMKERDPEINISHSTLPTWEEHCAYVHRRPLRAWYLIEVELPGVLERTRIGFVSATWLNEIGIVLLKRWRFMGYGKAIIRRFLESLPPLPAEVGVRRGRWIANVAPGNQASHALFQSLGGKAIQVTYEL